MNELIKKDINRKCKNAYEIKIKALQEKIMFLKYEKKMLLQQINDFKTCKKVLNELLEKGIK